LPPGTYYLSAVTDAEPTELGDTAFLEQLAAASLTFTLKEGEVYPLRPGELILAQTAEVVETGMFEVPAAGRR